MTALLSIGEPAARTGLPVRTIRFSSDRGVLPPAWEWLIAALRSRSR